MFGRGRFSGQTVLVLVALAAASTWRHGYDLARDAGLNSGTLYPILIRLAACGLIEARWQDGQTTGQPRRHLYRVTAAGLAAATAGQVPHTTATATATAAVGSVRAVRAGVVTRSGSDVGEHSR